MQEKLVAEFPTSPEYQVRLAGTYGNLANIVRDNEKPAEALSWYGKVVKILAPIVAQNKKEPNAQLFLRNAHWDRANALGQLRRHTEAIKDWQRAIELDDDFDKESLQLFQQTAQMEEKLKAEVKPPNAAAPAGLLFDAARVHARAAAAAEKSGEPSLKKRYTDRALELLKLAKMAGYFGESQRIEQLGKDGDFELLRQDARFQEFLKSLAAGTNAK